MYFCALFAALFSLWLYKRYRRMTFLRRNGIPGPAPNLLFGNALELKSKGIITCYREWTEKYGKMVGFYIGGSYNVFTTDLELLREMQIKSFDKFNKKPQIIEGGLWPTDLGQKTLLFTDPHSWRKIRHLTSPSFTTAKLQRMVSVIAETIECETSSKIRDAIGNADDSVNLSHIVGNLSSKLIIRVCFGLDVAFDKNVQQKVTDFIEGKLDGFFATVLILFPELSPIVYPIRKCWTTFIYSWELAPPGYIINLLRKLIKKKKCNMVPGDFLYSLINDKVTIRKLNERVKSMTEDDYEVQESGEDVKVGMTDDEVLMALFMFLGAARSTTTATLTFIFHNLLNNAEWQHKVRQEVKALMHREGRLDCNVMQLPLLDGVIKESLRLNPPADLLISNEPFDDFEFDGVTIPRGCGVFSAGYLLHYDEKYYPNPNQFDPMRFVNGTVDPITFQAFGQGEFLG